MNANVVREFCEIHDFEINSYHVDIINKRLELDTEYIGGKKTQILFSGLLAHHFEHVIHRNILFDITQITIDCYITNYADFLKRSLPYDFPNSARSADELRRRLIDGEYCVYEISSSYGLHGIVIAKDLIITANIMD